ncbi:MAG: TolC family protein [Acidobacteria bacterium]|nr:TolC family protein [Acidobacteriota bacterium]
MSLIFEARLSVKRWSSRSRASRASSVLASVLLVAATVSAQTPTPRTPSSPQTDPTRPPSVERPTPQIPPGTAPAQPSTPAPAILQPSTHANAAPVQGSPPGTATQQPDEGTPNPLLQARPLPPLPSMTRLGVSADQTLALSLNEAVRRALENNTDIEVAREEVRFAETVLRSLEGVYDPVFVATPQFNSRVTPVASTLGGSGSSGTVNTTDINYDSSLTRQFKKGGGQYEFFFNNTRETTSSTFSSLNPFYSSSLGVRFTQPLMRNREIDLSRRTIRIQQRLVAQTDADFRRRTIDVITSVQVAYWDLVLALRDQQNRLANLKLTRELHRQNEARIAAGSVAPFERAEVQTELANRESELLESSQNVTIAENNLKQLILHDSLAPEWSAQLTPTDEPVFDETPVSLADALTEARANRPELKRLGLQKEINDIDLQYFKSQARPRLDIEAVVATTGLAGSPIVATGTVPGGQAQTGPLIGGNANTNPSAFLLQQINDLRQRQGLPAATVPQITSQAGGVPARLAGGYFQTLRNLSTLKTRNIVVGVRLELPLHNRAAKEQLAGAQIRRTQLETTVRGQDQAIEAEVRNAAQTVEIARQRVLAARSARESAELQLQGERRLYEFGHSTTFLLFQRQNQLAGTLNQQLRAVTDYNKALAVLQRATSTTLKANNVTVERAAGER